MKLFKVVANTIEENGNVGQWDTVLAEKATMVEAQVLVKHNSGKFDGGVWFGNTDMVNLTDEETTQRIAANLEVDNG